MHSKVIMYFPIMVDHSVHVLTVATAYIYGWWICSSRWVVLLISLPVVVRTIIRSDSRCLSKEQENNLLVYHDYRRLHGTT